MKTPFSNVRNLKVNRYLSEPIVTRSSLQTNLNQILAARSVIVQISFRPVYYTTTTTHTLECTNKRT